MRPGTVGQPFRSEPRDALAVRIVWLCIGVTIYAGLTAFIVKAVRTVAAQWGGA